MAYRNMKIKSDKFIISGIILFLVVITGFLFLVFSKSAEILTEPTYKISEEPLPPQPENPPFPKFPNNRAIK